MTHPGELLGQESEDNSLPPYKEGQSDDLPGAEPEDTPEKTTEDHSTRALESLNSVGTQGRHVPIGSSDGVADDAERDKRSEDYIGDELEDRAEKKFAGGKKKTRGKGPLREMDFDRDSEWKNYKLELARGEEFKKMQMSEEELMRHKQKEADKKAKKKQSRKFKQAKERVEAADLSKEEASAQPVDVNVSEGDDVEEMRPGEETGPIEETEPIDETMTIGEEEQSSQTRPKKRRGVRAGKRRRTKQESISTQDPVDSKGKSLLRQHDHIRPSQDAQNSAFFESLLKQPASNQSQDPEREINDSTKRRHSGLEQRRRHIEAARQTAEAVAARAVAEALIWRGVSDEAQKYFNSRGHFNPHTLSMEGARQAWAGLPAPVISLNDFIPDIHHETIFDPAVRERIDEYEEELKNKAAMGELHQERVSELAPEFLPVRPHSVASHRNVVADIWPINIIALEAETYVRPVDLEADGLYDLAAEYPEGQDRERAQPSRRRGSCP